VRQHLLQLARLRPALVRAVRAAARAHQPRHAPPRPVRIEQPAVRAAARARARAARGAKGHVDRLARAGGAAAAARAGCGAAALSEGLRLG
jgi:hypothetical protein